MVKDPLCKVLFQPCLHWKPHVLSRPFDYLEEKYQMSSPLSLRPKWKFSLGGEREISQMCNRRLSTWAFGLFRPLLCYLTLGEAMRQWSKCCWFQSRNRLTLSVHSWKKTVQVLEQGTSFYVLRVFVQCLEKCPGPWLNFMSLVSVRRIINFLLHVLCPLFLSLCLSKRNWLNSTSVLRPLKAEILICWAWPENRRSKS